MVITFRYKFILTLFYVTPYKLLHNLILFFLGHLQVRSVS